MSLFLIGMLSECCDDVVYNGIFTEHERGTCMCCNEINGHYDAEEKERLELRKYELEINHRLEIFNKFDEYGVGYNL